MSRIGSDGLPTTVVELPTPSGLEYDHGLLYVSYNDFENGSIASIDVGRD